MKFTDFELGVLRRLGFTPISDHEARMIIHDEMETIVKDDDGEFSYCLEPITDDDLIRGNQTTQKDTI